MNSPTAITETGSVELGHLKGDISFITRMLRTHILAKNAPIYDTHGIAGGEIVLLSLIGMNPGLTQKDISRIVVLKKSALTKLVNELEGNGLIVRQKIGTDKRLNSLRLTEKGRRKLERLKPDLARQQSALLAPLSDAERGMLFELLWKLVESYGGIDGSGKP